MDSGRVLWWAAMDYTRIDSRLRIGPAWPLDAQPVIEEAARLRLDAARGLAVTVVRMGDLPAFGIVGAKAFWGVALIEACKHGPPMIGALLLVQKDDLFNEIARRDRAKLLQHLRQSG